jgi:hypothetical protein
MKLTLPINRHESPIPTSRLSRYMRDMRRPLLAFLICASLWSGLISPVSAKAKKPSAKPKAKPVVTDIQYDRLVPAPDATNKTIPLSVQISGTSFGKTLAPTSVRVSLINQKSKLETRATVTVATDTAIIVRAEAPVNEDGSCTCEVDLQINGSSVDTSGHLIPVPSSARLPKTETPSRAKPFEVEFNQIKTSNSRSLEINTKNDEAEFGADPALMKVALLPAGATNITIEPAVSPQKIFVSFVAPDDFVVKDVLVTVFDENKKLIAYSGQPLPEKDEDGRIIAKEKPANEEVKITSVDILSLQRRDGFGRLKIEGSGFGNYGMRSGEGELELLCDPRNRAYSALETRDMESKQAARRVLCSGFTGRAKGVGPPSVPSPGASPMADVERSVNILLVPRNPDLRVERTQILYIDDKLIDVYFEFSHWENYSEPFRLESVTVTVNKEQAITSAETKSAHARTGTQLKTVKTYIAAHNIGSPRDRNLEYRYTVLDEKDASQLFGSGVGENFYVLQLSVVNNGDKKLVIPLSSIQAEIEWYYGEDEKTISYDEGPPTLSPLKLSAITSYFDAFQKTKGKKARLFNILDGVGTLAASLVPVFGKGLERGNSIMAGGLIPGLHKAWGDLSSQQLQNLSAMSWESIEEIPAGGSKEKFIYIQRSDQVFRSKDAKFEIHKTIKSLQGLEVAGFIVNDSRPAAAVPQP